MRHDLCRHKRKPEPVFRLVLGHEIALLRRETQNGRNCRLALDKREGPLCRVTVGFRYPAAIDQNDPPVGQPERRDDVKAGIAFIGAAGHEDFPVMVEFAGQ